MPYTTTLSVPIAMRMADPSRRLSDPASPMGSTKAIQLENEDLRKRNEELAAELAKLRITDTQPPTPTGPQKTTPTKSYMQMTSSARIRKTATTTRYSTPNRTPEATTVSDKPTPAARKVSGQRRNTWNPNFSRAAPNPNYPSDDKAIPRYMQSTASSYQKRASQKGVMAQINRQTRPKKYRVGTQSLARRRREYIQQYHQHQQQPARQSLPHDLPQTPEPMLEDQPQGRPQPGSLEEEGLRLQDFVPRALRLSPPPPKARPASLSRYALPESMATIIEMPDAP